MNVVDKARVLERASDGERLVLELGCGTRKRHADAIGVDALDYPGVDLVGDIFEVLSALPEGCAKAVYAYHFFEHITDLDRLLAELARVLQIDGILDVEVPHFANPYFYSDPTHTRHFGLYTFCYLAEGSLFRRRVPQYGVQPKFRLIDVALHFDSPFAIRGVLRRAFGRLFNLSRWLQEFHEENLCYLFPCYQIRYELRRV